MTGDQPYPLTEYQAGGFTFRTAETQDDETLQGMLRDNPMDGWIQLTLERAPSFFSGENLMGRSTTVIARDSMRDNEAIGMYHTTQMTLFINGSPQIAGYLGGLRVTPLYRHRLRVLKHGYESIRLLTPSIDTRVWFTSMASDNTKARRLLEAGIQGLPHYTPIGELETLAISTRQGRSQGLLRRATENDIQRICHFCNEQFSRYQFAPKLTPDWLIGLDNGKGLGIEDFWLYENGEELLACIALWDQRPFKQTVVRGFRFPLQQLRPLYNIAAYLRGKPLLPKIDTAVESIYLAFFSCASSVEERSAEILREALFQARLKDAKIGLLGLSVQNPLLQPLRKSLKAESYRTCIEYVRWPDKHPFSFTLYPAQPEIALL